MTGHGYVKALEEVKCSTEGCQNKAICEDKDPICTSCLRGLVISYEAQKIVEAIDKRRDNKNMSYDEYQEFLKSQNQSSTTEVEK